MAMYKVLERASLSSKLHKIIREDEKGNKKTHMVDFVEEGDLLEWDEKNGPPPLWLEVPGRETIRNEMGMREEKGKIPKTMKEATGLVDDGGDPAQQASTAKALRDKLDAMGITYFKGATLEVLQGILREAEDAKKAA